MYTVNAKLENMVNDYVKMSDSDKAVYLDVLYNDNEVLYWDFSSYYMEYEYVDDEV
jgi:hypothetical protein